MAILAPAVETAATKGTKPPVGGSLLAGRAGAGDISAGHTASRAWGAGQDGYWAACWRW